MGDGLAASRRFGIVYIFEHVYGNSEADGWQGSGGVLSQVMCRLDIPSNSMTLVRHVFLAVAKAIDDDTWFCGSQGSFAEVSSYTSLYLLDDPGRFDCGVPSELLSSTRMWAVAPTCRRIIDDIEVLP